MVMQRHIALLLAVLALAAPAPAQTIYALREQGRPVFITDPPQPTPPEQKLDLVQFTGGVTAGYADVTSLMPLPLDSDLVAFDAVRRRAYLTLRLQANLYVADLEARTLTPSAITAANRTFAFDSAHETLYATEGSRLLAIDPALGTATTVAAADRNIVLCGLDPVRGHVFVSDPGGGELRYVDINTHTLSSVLLTVDGPASVLAEAEGNVVDIIRSGRSRVIRFDLSTWTSAVTDYQTVGFVASVNALDPLSGHIYAVQFSDWNLITLANIDVRKGTASSVYVKGDYAAVVVAPDAPPKRRAIRGH
jgi:hypothetical protein